MNRILPVCLITMAAMGGQIQFDENGDGAPSKGKVTSQQNAFHNIQTNEKRSAFTGAIGTLHGKLKELNDKIIEIETHECHIISIRRTHKTKFFKNCEPIKASDIDLETAVAIDVRTASAGFLGVNVSVDSSPRQAFAK
jgi:hypothetical protein